MWQFWLKFKRESQVLCFVENTNVQSKWANYKIDWNVELGKDWLQTAGVCAKNV